MVPRGNERGLLFGLLALQNHFIDRDGLVAAFSIWVADRNRPIDRILLDQNLLAPDVHAVVSALVDKHLEFHHDAPTSALPSDALRERDSGGPVTARGEDDDATTTIVGDRCASNGRFWVLRCHARGGLGEVFVARDDELHRDVALKVIQEPFADDMECRERFLLEAEITGRLEHPGIVPVYALGEDPRGRPYYAMRFIRGKSLKVAIDEFHERDEDGVAARDAGKRTLALRDLLASFLTTSP